MARLTMEQIAEQLKRLPGWALRKDRITKTFGFKSFREAVAFVNKIADLAEQERHHPDIDIRWTKASIALKTYAEDALTERDFDMARKIDEVHAQERRNTSVSTDVAP